ALDHWALLCEPLLLLDAHEGFSDPEMTVAPDRVFGLLGDLCNHRHYLRAQQVLDHALEAFGSIPDTAARLAEAGEILRDMQRAALNGIEPDRDPAVPVESRGFRHAKKAMLVAAALLAWLEFWLRTGLSTLERHPSPWHRIRLNRTRRPSCFPRSAKANAFRENMFATVIF